MRPDLPDPVADWRRRWQSGASPQPTPRTGPRSPWVYLLAAFGGTFLALCVCVALAAGGLLALVGAAGRVDLTPSSVTYVNDTADDVWIYECIDRCRDVNGVFPLEAGDETSFGLAWYVRDEVDWVVVTHQDGSYGCIRLGDWGDQTIRVSLAAPCPADVHSPENSVA